MSWQLVASGYVISIAWLFADCANWTAPLHRWRSYRPAYEAMLWDLVGMLATLALALCVLFAIVQAAISMGFIASLLVSASYGLAVWGGMALSRT